MRYLLPVLLLLASASAAVPYREVLHPKSDQPAFRCLIPADWSSEVDALGNLLLANRDHTANFSITLVPTTNSRESLEPLAKVLLGSAVNPPWDNQETAEISGYRGHKYTARVRHTNGVTVRAEVMLVAVGEGQVAACSMLLSERIRSADEVTARLVFAAIHLVPGPGAPP